MMPTASLRTFLIAAGIVAGLVAWALLAPVPFGGSVQYIVIRGNSMEPTFYAGDLVLTRVAPEYRVGDVVAYQHPEVGLVVHRLIEYEHGRFVFRGDNNGFTDGYRPTREELAGRVWFRIPRLGSWLLTVRQPLPFALLTAFAVAGVVWPQAKRPRRHRSHSTPFDVTTFPGGPR